MEPTSILAAFLPSSTQRDHPKEMDRLIARGAAPGLLTLYGAEITSQRETGLRSKSVVVVHDASEHIPTANRTDTRT